MRVGAIAPVVVRLVAVPVTGRRPADITRAIRPVHPRRRVTCSRHPHPSVERVVGPASVVIRDPAPGFVRGPREVSARAVAPAAIKVRTPAGRYVRTPRPGIDRGDVLPRAVV